MYNGTNPIPSAKLFIEELVSRSIPHLYVTNNATKTPQDVVSFLKDICDIDVREEHIYTSGIAAIDYVAKRHPNARAYIVGEAALKSQAEEAGLLLAEDDIEVVIQGLDRNTTYQKLALASTAIRKGAAFIATNPDFKLPTEKGMMPGSGALTSFIQATTGVTPTVIGKPCDPIMEGALARMGLERKDVVMVGDNYQTDILAGIQYGIDTILTLTGVTSLSDIEAVEKKPTHIVTNLTEWTVC